MGLDFRKPLTLALLIQRLKDFEDIHGPDTPVYCYDPDGEVCELYPGEVDFYPERPWNGKIRPKPNRIHIG